MTERTSESERGERAAWVTLIFAGLSAPAAFLMLIPFRSDTMDVVLFARTGAWIVVAIGFFALTAAIVAGTLRRRAAGRIAEGLCVLCGYSRTGTSAPRCPECGDSWHRGNQERHSLVTMSLWTIWYIVLAAWIGFVGVGWVAGVPTTRVHGGVVSPQASGRLPAPAVGAPQLGMYYCDIRSECIDWLGYSRRADSDAPKRLLRFFPLESTIMLLGFDYSRHPEGVEVWFDPSTSQWRVGHDTGTSIDDLAEALDATLAGRVVRSWPGGVPYLRSLLTSQLDSTPTARPYATRSALIRLSMGAFGGALLAATIVWLRTLVAKTAHGVLRKGS